MKEIQDICGITKTLHTHLGRTTYICYLYNKGVPVDIIARIVGHRTAQTTLKYYAELDRTTITKAIKEKAMSSLPTPKQSPFMLTPEQLTERVRHREVPEMVFVAEIQ